MEANEKPPRPEVKCTFFQPDRCRHQFPEKGNTDPCELQQNTWAPLPKPLVVDSGAGETVMPVDWLTSHPLTESDGQEQMISIQQPMAAKCTTKDKEILMFAHLTDNSEDP